MSVQAGVFSVSFGAHISYDALGKIVNADEVVASLCGVPKEELIGRSITSLVPAFKPESSLPQCDEFYSRVNLLIRDGRSLPVSLTVNKRLNGKMFIPVPPEAFKKRLRVEKEEERSVSTPEMRRSAVREIAIVTEAFEKKIDTLSFILDSNVPPMKVLAEARRQFDVLKMHFETYLEKMKFKIGKTHLEKQVFAFRPLINEICGTYQKLFQDKGEFIVFIKDDVPEQIYSDPVKIRFIFHRLLENAVSATEEGLIRVVVYKKSSYELSIKVEHSRQIIDERLFDGSSTGSPEIIPCGNSIEKIELGFSKELAHMLGGKLIEEEITDSYAVFTLDIPLSSFPVPEVSRSDIGSGNGDQEGGVLMANCGRLSLDDLEAAFYSCLTPG